MKCHLAANCVNSSIKFCPFSFNGILKIVIAWKERKKSSSALPQKYRSVRGMDEKNGENAMDFMHVMSHLRAGGILNRQTGMAVIVTASCMIVLKFLLRHFLNFSALFSVSFVVIRKSSCKTDVVINHRRLIESKRKFLSTVFISKIHKHFQNIMNK